MWLASTLTSKGVLLKIATKDSGVGHRQLTRRRWTVALCYVWIDGHKGALDEAFLAAEVHGPALALGE